jgi:hypothetical protein
MAVLDDDVVLPDRDQQRLEIDSPGMALEESRQQTVDLGDVTQAVGEIEVNDARPPAWSSLKKSV